VSTIRLIIGHDLATATTTTTTIHSSHQIDRGEGLPGKATIFSIIYLAELIVRKEACHAALW